MSQVRVRFAPSPTGFFHIGSARTALFNWLYARHTGGTFVLRIEDTDKERDNEDFLNVIYEGLNWLGMSWDEGPGVGGDYGPYRQSERGHIYKQYLQTLKKTGRTYEKDGAIWFKVSGETQIIEDAIRGRVERKEERDFVIIRSDGSPIFHFVNVVDDIAMKITHVIRGEDHLSNTSKHAELFKAFNVEPPIFAHIPLILKSNGKGKMSKRDQGALIEEYQRRGFLPEALVNFLSLLGWNPGDNSEIINIKEIIRLFNLSDANKGNARFDEKKLAHFNTVYLQNLSQDRFAKLASFYFLKVKASLFGKSLDYFNDVMLISRTRIKSLEELPNYTEYFFNDDFCYKEDVAERVLGREGSKERLVQFSKALNNFDFSTNVAIESGIRALAKRNGLKFGDYQNILRFAVSGTNVGPNITDVLRVLGKERVVLRVNRFLSTI